MARMLQERAKAEGLSLSAVLRRALREAGYGAPQNGHTPSDRNGEAPTT